ncbi:hypothetical protein ACFLZQ_03140 [Thermodesulfobacteriota bacterium]
MNNNRVSLHAGGYAVNIHEASFSPLSGKGNTYLFPWGWGMLSMGEIEAVATSQQW